MRIVPSRSPPDHTVETKGATDSFPWPAIWIAIFFAVAVLFSCIGLPGMAMNIGFGGAAPLTIQQQDGHHVRRVCGRSDEVNPNATEVDVCKELAEQVELER